MRFFIVLLRCPTKFTPLQAYLADAQALCWISEAYNLSRSACHSYENKRDNTLIEGSLEEHAAKPVKFLKTIHGFGGFPASIYATTFNLAWLIRKALSPLTKDLSFSRRERFYNDYEYLHSDALTPITSTWMTNMRHIFSAVCTNLLADQNIDQQMFHVRISEMPKTNL